jgi:hypothetical protein
MERSKYKISVIYCEFKECEKHESCKRFQNQSHPEGVEVRFKNICPNNNFQWYWRCEQSVEKKY